MLRKCFIIEKVDDLSFSFVDIQVEISCQLLETRNIIEKLSILSLITYHSLFLRHYPIMTLFIPYSVQTNVLSL